MDGGLASAAAAAGGNAGSNGPWKRTGWTELGVAARYDALVCVMSMSVRVRVGVGDG